MSSAGWDEIKRLARDLQRVQLAESTQRLSERNCIEIVQRLTELKLLDVLYTTDGKEYITPVELGKEIREELIIQQGRIDLTQLQQTLNVDYSHVEAKVNELVRNDRNLTLVLGQLIDRGYLDRLCEEINEKLDTDGLISIADLTKLYDLPSDFLHEIIQERLGSVVKAVRDEVDRNVYYTQRLIDCQTARVRGVISALTRPTAVGSIITRYNLLPHLFFSILDRLQTEGCVSGTLSGGRTERAVFIPDCYSKAQTEWIDNFYRQNGYLEYDTLTRLGISDGRGYIKRRLKAFGDVEFLESCCIGSAVTQRVEAELEEALTTGSWFDAMPILPSVCSTADAAVILQTVLKSRQQLKQSSAVPLVSCTDSIVASEELITRCHQSFTDLISKKAEQTVRENPSILLSQFGGRSSQQTAAAARARDAAGDTASASTGGGGGRGEEDQRKKKGGAKRTGIAGREVKTKSLNKKKGGGRGVEEAGSDNEEGGGEQRQEVEFMSVQKVEETLRDVSRNPYLRDCPEELLSAIAQRLYRPLSKEYGEQLKSVYLQTVVHQDQLDTAAGTGTDGENSAVRPTAGSAASAAAKKKSRSSELVDKIGSLWTNVKLYEKSLTLFNEEVEPVLTRHLLQTVCTELVDAVLLFNTPDDTILLSITSDINKPLTNEARTKLLSILGEGRLKQTLNKILTALSGKSVADCLTYIEAVSMMGDGQLQHSIKKPDKKKERQLVFNHRQALAEQLRAEDVSAVCSSASASTTAMSPALLLHMCVVLLCETVSQCMIHAPGRAVPHLITYLQHHLLTEQYNMLTRAQELVLKHITLTQASRSADSASAPDDVDELGSVCRQLSESLCAVKELALTVKKSTAASAAVE